MTTVGFEPTLSRTSALSWRLRPLGQVAYELTITRAAGILVHHVAAAPSAQGLRPRFYSAYAAFLRLSRLPCITVRHLDPLYDPGGPAARRTGRWSPPTSHLQQIRPTSPEIQLTPVQHGRAPSSAPSVPMKVDVVPLHAPPVTQRRANTSYHAQQASRRHN